MSKDINIKHRLVRIPEKIVVDGIDYPLHQRNFEVISEYEATGDESVLDKLANFSIQF